MDTHIVIIAVVQDSHKLSDLLSVAVVIALKLNLHLH